MRVAILGCGFMGGSFAAALRRRNLATSITGYDVDPDAGPRGVTLGLLDAAASSCSEAARQANLIVLASPVGAMPGLLSDIAAELRPAAIATDLGSTKADVVDAARRALGPSFARFVPAHPIAGGERPGLERADPDLFEGCTVVITPAEETRADAAARVEHLWHSCGARVVRMDAGEHDRVLASVSHLPHMVAFALVAHIARQPDAQRRLELAGPGFRDFTRIAASSAAMWRDIALANRDAIGGELGALIAELQRVDQALSAGDSRYLQELFELASQARRRLNGEADGR